MTTAFSASEFLSNDIAEASAGGPTSSASSDHPNRLSGAAPQPREKNSRRFLCGECGSADIQATAWIHVNTGEVVNDEGPTDQLWCPDCEADCSTLEDCGLGFDLWLEAEWGGWFATFAEALAEAKESDRPYDISEAITDGRIVEAVFPRLNKQDTLACTKKEISRDNYTQRVRVQASYTVSADEWCDLTNNLLSRRDLWAGKGGTDSEYDGSKALGDELFKWPEAERKLWIASSYRLVIEVVHADTHERIYIDPQGYDYARYVGVPK